MKVLITGGAGRVGKPVVAQFVLKGWETRVIDLEKDVTLEGAEYVHCDILNYADLREQMRGCQAVVHLAAISHPMQIPGPALFQTNTASTYNVFQAAADEGIRRVVQASSINAFGCFWGITDTEPDYFPINEEHPTNTTDAYSFSKAVVEDIGAYFWRRAGISSVAFRLPGVWDQAHTLTDHFIKRKQDAHNALDEFCQQSKAAQKERMDRMQKVILEYRSQRMFEHPQAADGFQLKGLEKSLDDEPLWSQYLFERFNFWAYIDERDVAVAMEQGVTAAYEGSHPLFINAENNSLNYKSRILIDAFFPKISQMKCFYDGAQSLVSSKKAEDLISFRPEFSLTT